MLCTVSIKPPGLALDKDYSNECVTGTNVWRGGGVPKRGEEKAAVRYKCIVLVS
jgi:hypothetical protein